MTQMIDWRDLQTYAYTKDLTGSGWAWEFLRRNTDYRREWAAFMETWHALEADYGVAPARDFPRWKRDRRANVFEPPLAEGERVDDWVKRTGNDCVAIECAFGARWGLFKFPPDPDKNAIELGDGLGWREVPSLARVMGADDRSYFGAQDNRLALGFDLDRPLKQQLEEARRFLIARQHRLKRDGSLQMQTVAGLRDEWLLMLRYLDAQQEGVKHKLTLGDDSKQRAVTLMQGAYRELLALPL